MSEIVGVVKWDEGGKSFTIDYWLLIIVELLNGEYKTKSDVAVVGGVGGKSFTIDY